MGYFSAKMRKKLVEIIYLQLCGAIKRESVYKVGNIELKHDIVYVDF